MKMVRSKSQWFSEEAFRIAMALGSGAGEFLPNAVRTSRPSAKSSYRMHRCLVNYFKSQRQTKLDKPHPGAPERHLRYACTALPLKSSVAALRESRRACTQKIYSGAEIPSMMEHVADSMCSPLTAHQSSS